MGVPQSRTPDLIRILKKDYLPLSELKSLPVNDENQAQQNGNKEADDT